MSDKPRLLILSHVLPFPGNAGQQQRVLNTLKGLRPLFHLTFLTLSTPGKEDEVRRKLLETCDDVILLPSLYNAPGAGRWLHRAKATLFCWRTGLKTSNYALSRLEFSPERIGQLLDEQKRAGREFDGVLYEYWHAADSTEAFRKRGIPTALDMHDILWMSYDRQMAYRGGPSWWKKRAVELYKRAEEASWLKFDLLISINDAEHDYARKKVPDKIPFINAYMGVDTEETWPYKAAPASPPRLAYYGGLGTRHNQESAMRCYQSIMPIVWEKAPETELWVVGSNPPAELKALEADARVKVTGFVPDVKEVLATLTAVLCPWEGKYGFRSRLMEAMATGVPVIATSDAVYGMSMQDGQGLLLEETDEGMAQAALCLIQDQARLTEQSRRARRQVVEQYGFDATYGRLARELRDFILQ
jgi:glycosyltransferase involved in cell wall biosynthesis